MKLYLAVHNTEQDFAFTFGPFVTMTMEEIVEGLSEQPGGLDWDKHTVTIVEVPTTPQAN